MAKREKLTNRPTDKQANRQTEKRSEDNSQDLYFGFKKEFLHKNELVLTDLFTSNVKVVLNSTNRIKKIWRHSFPIDLVIKNLSCLLNGFKHATSFSLKTISVERVNWRYADLATDFQKKQDQKGFKNVY